MTVDDVYVFGAIGFVCLVFVAGVVLLTTLLAAAGGRAPLASCGWCGASFDSVPAFTSHVLECDRGASW